MVITQTNQPSPPPRPDGPEDRYGRNIAETLEFRAGKSIQPINDNVRKQVVDVGVGVLESQKRPPLDIEFPEALQNEFEKLYDALEKANTFEQPKDFPPGVDPHLASHMELLNRLHAEKRIGPKLYTILKAFILHHDLGYSDTELDLERDKAELLAMFADNARVAGKSEAEAKKLAQEAYDLVSEKKNRDNYLVRKVLLHGAGGIVPVIRRLTEAGMTPKAARGFARLFATHHLDYPISMVNTFVVNGLIKPELCPVFLIDTEKGAAAQQEMKKTFDEGKKRKLTDKDFQRIEVLKKIRAENSADLLRVAHARVAVDETGLSQQDCELIEAMGYGLDRTTPARRMRDIQINEKGVVQTDAKGNFLATGETNKKYPLIITNIGEIRGLTLEECYRLAFANVTQERDAAIATAKAMGQLAIADTIRVASDFEIGELKKVQDEALAFAKSLDFFTGNFLALEADLEIAREAYLNPELKGADRDAAAYLVATLQCIQGNTNAQGKIRTLIADERDAMLDALERARFDREFTESELDAITSARRVLLGVPAMEAPAEGSSKELQQCALILSLLDSSGIHDRETREELVRRQMILVDYKTYRQAEERSLGRPTSREVRPYSPEILELERTVQLAEKTGDVGRRLFMIAHILDYAKAHPERTDLLQRVRLFPSEKPLITEGGKNDRVYILLPSSTASVIVDKKNADGIIETTGKLSRRVEKMKYPNIAGELSARNNGIAVATVIIEGEPEQYVDAITFPHKDFLRFFDEEDFSEIFGSLAIERYSNLLRQEAA